MPKVTKSGVFSPEYGFPEKPPAKLETQCHFCFAKLETTEDESSVQFGIKIDTASGVRLPGWKIPCPECGKKVFFPAVDFSSEVFQLLNKGKLAHLLK